MAPFVDARVASGLPIRPLRFAADVGGHVAALLKRARDLLDQQCAVASRAPLPISRMTSSRFPNRVWVRQILNDLAGRLGPADVPILTDDFAPVARLLRNVSAFGD